MPESPNLGKDYTIRYPLVRPEYIGVITTQDPASGRSEITPMTCIRATTLLEQEPLTPQTAVSLVDLVYDYYTPGYTGLEAAKQLMGSNEKQVRNIVREAAASGRIKWLGETLRAAEQLLPSFKPSRLELAGLFKTAYTVAANQPPTEYYSENPAQHEVYNTLTLQFKTCAAILGAAEEVLSKSEPVTNAKGSPNFPIVPIPPELYTNVTLTMEDGNEVATNSEVITFIHDNRHIRLRPGLRFTFSGERFYYAGVDASGNVVAKIDTGKRDETIHKIIPLHDLQEQWVFAREQEVAEQLFGEDFLGEEAIQTFEEKCKLNGINVEFEIPDIDFQYSEEELQIAKDEEKDGKARMVVLRPQWMTVNGVRQKVNLLNLRNLFKREEKDSSGTVVKVDSENSAA